MYREKEVTKTVYNNVINSIKVYYKMDIILTNSENSKTSELHRLLLNISDKTILKRSSKHVALSNLSIFYTWKEYEKIKNNKFKILAPTWDEKFEIPDGSHFVSAIQKYFEYANQKYQTVTDNPPVRIYA